VIRPATIDDIRQIYDWIEAYHKEAMAKLGMNLDWDREMAVIQLGNWLWHDEFNINLIADHGCMLGEVKRNWFGKDRIGDPYVLYVDPKHRNGFTARLLMKRFEQECRRLGAIAISWDNWAGITDGDMLTSFLAYLGYQERGKVYSKIFGGNNGSVDADLDDCGQRPFG
jgi:GNAT superfamily N-acetyltransferase